LSLLDAVGAAIQARNVTTVGLLGTRFTMEDPFYREALERQGLMVLLPDAAERALVNRVIYEELVAGRILPASREAFLGIIRRLVDCGAEGVILGCTEIPLLVDEASAGVPLFDTTTLHAEAALGYAMKETA
ncbi:MAG: amino acid racemase, partial [Anaerolineae bacterium]|nr:amino acid racemase [Anaerolineae bacterium]